MSFSAAITGAALCGLAKALGTAAEALQDLRRRPAPRAVLAALAGLVFVLGDVAPLALFTHLHVVLPVGATATSLAAVLCASFAQDEDVSLRDAGGLALSLFGVLVVVTGAGVGDYVPARRRLLLAGPPPPAALAYVAVVLAGLGACAGGAAWARRRTNANKKPTALVPTLDAAVAGAVGAQAALALAAACALGPDDLVPAAACAGLFVVFTTAEGVLLRKAAAAYGAWRVLPVANAVLLVLAPAGEALCLPQAAVSPPQYVGIFIGVLCVVLGQAVLAARELDAVQRATRVVLHVDGPTAPPLQGAAERLFRGPPPQYRRLCAAVVGDATVGAVRGAARPDSVHVLLLASGASQTPYAAGRRLAKAVAKQLDNPPHLGDHRVSDARVLPARHSLRATLDVRAATVRASRAAAAASCARLGIRAGAREEAVRAAHAGVLERRLAECARARINALDDRRVPKGASGRPPILRVLDVSVRLAGDGGATAELLVTAPAKGAGALTRAVAKWAAETRNAAPDTTPTTDAPAAPAAPIPTRKELAPGWTALVDPASGRKYYHSAARNETVWDRPTVEVPVEPEATAVEVRDEHLEGGGAVVRLRDPVWVGTPWFGGGFVARFASTLVTVATSAAATVGDDGANANDPPTSIRLPLKGGGGTVAVSQRRASAGMHVGVGARFTRIVPALPPPAARRAALRQHDLAALCSESRASPLAQEARRLAALCVSSTSFSALGGVRNIAGARSAQLMTGGVGGVKTSGPKNQSMRNQVQTRVDTVQTEFERAAAGGDFRVLGSDLTALLNELSQFPDEQAHLLVLALPSLSFDAAGGGDDDAEAAAACCWPAAESLVQLRKCQREWVDMATKSRAAKTKKKKAWEREQEEAAKASKSKKTTGSFGKPMDRAAAGKNEKETERKKAAATIAKRRANVLYAVAAARAALCEASLAVRTSLSQNTEVLARLATLSDTLQETESPERKRVLIEAFFRQHMKDDYGMLFPPGAKEAPPPPGAAGDECAVRARVGSAASVPLVRLARPPDLAEAEHDRHEVEISVRRATAGENSGIVWSELQVWMRRNNVAVREIMSKFDAAESGRMTEEEFAAAMAEVGGKMAQDSLYDIMAHAEGVKSDTVTYREWFSGLEREVTERDVYAHLLADIREKRITLKEAFEEVDTNADGTVDKAEWARYCRRLGCVSSDADLSALFDSVDTDKSGSLDYAEWLQGARANATLEHSAMQELLRHRVTEARSEAEAGLKGGAVSMREVFSAFDADDSGRIDKSEFVSLTSQLGLGFKEHDARQIFQQMDKDDSGEIDWAEWEHMLADSGGGSAEVMRQRQLSHRNYKPDDDTAMERVVLQFCARVCPTLRRRLAVAAPGAEESKSSEAVDLLPAEQEYGHYIGRLLTGFDTFGEMLDYVGTKGFVSFFGKDSSTRSPLGAGHGVARAAKEATVPPAAVSLGRDLRDLAAQRAVPPDHAFSQSLFEKEMGHSAVSKEGLTKAEFASGLRHLVDSGALGSALGREETAYATILTDDAEVDSVWAYVTGDRGAHGRISSLEFWARLVHAELSLDEVIRTSLLPSFAASIVAEKSRVSQMYDAAAAAARAAQAATAALRAIHVELVATQGDAPAAGSSSAKGGLCRCSGGKQSAPPADAAFVVVRPTASTTQPATPDERAKARAGYVSRRGAPAPPVAVHKSAPPVGTLLHFNPGAVLCPHGGPLAAAAVAARPVAAPTPLERELARIRKSWEAEPEEEEPKAVAPIAKEPAPVAAASTDEVVLDLAGADDADAPPAAAKASMCACFGGAGGGGAAAGKDSGADEEEAAAAATTASVVSSAIIVVGQDVEARWLDDPEWHAAVVRADNGDGTYHIVYADGDEDAAVPAAKIRVPAPEAVELSPAAAVLRKHKKKKKQDGRGGRAAGGGDDDEDEDVDDDAAAEEAVFEKGDAVEARWHEDPEWHNAVVKKRHRNGEYSLVYEDGDKWKHAPATHVREVPAKEPEITEKKKKKDKDKDKEKVAAAAPKKSKKKQPSPAREEEEPPEPVVFDKGDAVEARWHEDPEWHNAVVKKRHRNGEYSLVYEDGDKWKHAPEGHVRAVAKRKAKKGRG